MKYIPNAVTSVLARSALQTQKASPQLLFVGGVVGMGATVVLACRATLKVEAVLLDHEKMLEKIESTRNIVAQEKDGTYTEHDAKRDKSVQLLRTGVEIGKLYGPAVVVGALSIAALAGSHNILSKRNAALTAAYGTLQKAFDGYRDRTAAVVGREREEEIYHDVQPCEIEDEKGKVTKRKVANGGAPYSFLFDEHNVNWEPVPEMNFLFLKFQQSWANQRLQARGHLFLNEVLEALGMEHTPAGAVTGWIKNNGDDYVDFGIFNLENEERIIDFMVGREKAVWLNFNVDGVIYKLI